MKKQEFYTPVKWGNKLNPVLGTGVEPPMDILMKHINAVTKDFYDKLEKYLIANLNTLGYTFQDKQEFYEFAKKRITRTKCQGEETYELYIDFANIEKRKLIGIYSEKMECNTDLNTGKISITIG
jgi:hypothetical protein